MFLSGLISIVQTISLSSHRGSRPLVSSDREQDQSQS
jgi:hypothetical protein